MIILIHTTTNTTQEAEQISQTLLKENLIKKAHIKKPIQTLSQWGNEIATDSETPLILQTLSKNRTKTIKRLKQLHPNPIPTILVFNVDYANSEYTKTLLQTL